MLVCESQSAVGTLPMTLLEIGTSMFFTFYWTSARRLYVLVKGGVIIREKAVREICW